MKRKKRIFLFTGGAISLVLIAFLLKLIINFSIRDKLPPLPDFEHTHSSLTEQIISAHRKAKNYPSADNIGSLGMIYHSNAFYDKAAICYATAIKRNPSQWIWHYFLGYLNSELGISDAAIENFRNVIEYKPDIYLAWYYSGEIFRKMGRTDKAEEYFNKIISLPDKAFILRAPYRPIYYPVKSYAMYHLARIYMDTNRLDLAEKRLLEINQRHRTFGPVYRLLGNVYALKGDIKLSREYINRAGDLPDYIPPRDTIIDKLSLISRSEDYLLKQIDLAAKGYNFEWAFTLLKNSLQHIPDNKHLISKAVKDFIKLDYGKYAMPFLDKHMEYYSDDLNELITVATSLQYKGFFHEAAKYYVRISELPHADPAGLAKIATSMWQVGLKDKAQNLIKEQLEKHPENIDVLANAGYFYLTQGNKEKASSYYLKLKNLFPSDKRTYSLGGLIADSEGDLNESVKMFKRVYMADPEDMSNIQYLGNAYVKGKMWKEAHDFFREALEHHPNEPYILERLGAILLSSPYPDLININEARNFSERAFIHYFSPFMTRLSAGRNLAIAYDALGDKKRAYDYLNTALNMARRENFPKEYLEALENDLKKLNQ